MEHTNQMTHRRETLREYFSQILRDNKFNHILTLKIDLRNHTPDYWVNPNYWNMYIDTPDILNMTWQGLIKINSIDQVLILVDWVPKQYLSLKDPNFDVKLKNIIDQSLSQHIAECSIATKYEPLSDSTTYH